MILENLLSAKFLAVILAVISVLLIKYYFDKRKIFLSGSKLPGPKGWPILGNILEFLHCDAMLKIEEYHRIYDLYALWFGHNLSVCIKSPQDAETYFNSPKINLRGENLKYFDLFMGKGLTFAVGEDWEKAKKILQPSFKYENLKHFIGVIRNETDILMHRLSKEEGNKLLAYPFIRNCLFDIINGGLFGVELKAQKHKLEIIETTQLIVELAFKRIFSPLQRLDILYKFLEDGKRFYQSFDAMSTFFNEILQKKMNYFKVKKATGKEIKNEFRELFWKNVFQNERVNDKEMQDYYYNTLAAGYESTSSSICFVLMMLALHPNVQEKTHEELISVVNEGQLDDEKVQNLEYLDRVINETLRLFPAIPVNSRKCSEDVRFGKYLVPAGSDIFLNTMALHRNPTQFKNPNEFNPDNFLPDNVSVRHPYAFLPFSTGPRKCIGHKLAMMMVKIIVGTLLIKYEIRCEYKSLEQIPFENTISLKMTDGCPIRLLNRYTVETGYNKGA